MLSFILSFVVLTALSTGSVYNPDTEICCSGEIHEATQSFQCCAKNVYDYGTHRCCGGVVTILPDDENGTKKWDCCGETWYDRKEFTKEGKGCCKNEIYDKSTQVCDHHTFEVFDLPGEIDLALCRGQLYNKTSQVCDYDVICDKLPNVQHLRCCGNNSYDPTKEICCIDTIHPVFTTSLETNICCGRNVYPDSTMYFGMSNHMTTKFMCCNGTVREKTFPSEKCCGLTSYNAADSLCCRDVVVENVQFGHRCCGNSAYNSEISTCCNGNIYPLSFSAQACCYDRSNTQDLINRESEVADMIVKNCQRSRNSDNKLLRRPLPF